MATARPNPIAAAFAKIAQQGRSEPRSGAMTPDEAIAYARAEIEAYLAQEAPDHALLLALPPGCGKSTLMVAIAEAQAKYGRVLYAAPRTDFYNDLMAMASNESDWLRWLPRQKGNDEQGIIETCRHADPIRLWIARGHDAPAFCSQNRVCGFDFMSKQCAYYAQAKTHKRLIFVQHSAMFRHPLLDGARLLIGDELPLGAACQPWAIPPSAIARVSGVGKEFAALLWSLYALTNDDAPEGKAWSGQALIAALGGAESVLGACAQLDADALQAPYLSDPQEAATVDYRHAALLAQLLSREAQAALDGRADWVRRVFVNRGGLLLLNRRMPSDTMPRHVIWCDATGDEHIYAALLGRKIRKIAPEVQMAGEIVQIVGSINNRTALLGKQRGGTIEDDSEEGRKLDRLRAQMGMIREANGGRVGVISYQAALPYLTLDGEQALHFGGNRGSNALEGQAVIVVGTPMIQPSDLLQQAAMLYYDRMTPFDLRWEKREVPYRNSPHAAMISAYWHDQDLNSLLEQHRRAEIEQAIFRARPLRRSVNVYLLSSYPINWPTRIVTQAELYGAIDADGNPIRGIRPERWLEFVGWLHTQLQTRCAVTAAEVAAAFEVSAPTARAMIQAATRSGEFALAVVKSSGGRPPLALAYAPKEA